MQTKATTRPRFRNDLVGQPVEEEGQVYVDVTDPDSGTAFRFYEIEYSVACAMDGTRDLAALQAWSRDELGVEPSEDEIRTVISTLDELGYLDSSAGDPATPPGGADVEGDRPTNVDLQRAGRPVASGAEAGPGAASGGADIDLGRAGAGAPQRAAVPATTAPGEDDEASFAGLAEGDRGAVPTEVSRAGTNPVERGEQLPIRARGEEAAPAAAAQRTRSEAASLRERARQTDDEDGPTNIPPPASQFDEEEVSVDLSDHLPIGTDDVKEAVRQSRGMEVPSAPSDDDDEEAEDQETSVASRTGSLAETADGARAEPKDAADEGDEGEAVPREPKPAAPAAAEAARSAREAGGGASGATPVDSPEARSEKLAAAAKPAEPPAEPKGSALGVAILVVILLAAVAGGGYYAVFHLGVLDEDEGAVADAAATEPEPEPEPEPATGELRATEPEAETVEAEVDGEVEWVAEEVMIVEEGTEIARLRGYERAAAALEDTLAEEERIQDRLDQAIADNAQRRAERLEERVEQAQEEIEELEEDLGQFVVRAPEAGEFWAEVAAGDTIEEGDILGDIASQPRHIVEFEVADTGDFAEGDSVTVASEATGEVSVCEVGALGDDWLEAVCPADSPLEEGETVVLEEDLVAPSP